MTSFLLPSPPSVNAAFFNRKPGAIGLNGKPLRGRGKTEIYERWQEAAGWEMVCQKVKPIKGPVWIHYLVEENPRRDLGNYEKVVTDLLVKMGIIEGDNCKTVRMINLSWSKSVTGVFVSITSPVEIVSEMSGHTQPGAA